MCRCSAKVSSLWFVLYCAWAITTMTPAGNQSLFLLAQLSPTAVWSLAWDRVSGKADDGHSYYYSHYYSLKSGYYPAAAQFCHRNHCQGLEKCCFCPSTAGNHHTTGLWCCLGEYQCQSCQGDVWIELSRINLKGMVKNCQCQISEAVAALYKRKQEAYAKAQPSIG